MKKALLLIYTLASLFSFGIVHADEHVKRVLIVPGHDDEYSGAAFGTIREVDLNRIVAQHLKAELSKESNVEVIMAHDDNGYADFLEEYFNKNSEAIEAFYTKAMTKFNREVKRGSIEVAEAVPHGKANPTSALRLYGINKWANENNIDLVLHVHFNDYGSRPWWGGEYSGFSVYVPHQALHNSEKAIPIGRSIYASLSEMMFSSNNPTEARYSSAIEDHELIALGAHNTLTVPSVLIEYSYIYEPFIHAGFFDRVAQEVAYRTRIGMKDFLKSTSSLPAMKPYTWNNNVKENIKALPSLDVYMLQLALKLDGAYPGEGKNQFDCPMTGIFGSCTKNALKKFQENNKLPATGYFGPMTRALLSTMY